MSSGNSSGPDHTFHDRINRVADHRPEDAGPVNVLPDWKQGFLGGKFGMILGLLIGVLSVLLVRIGSYHYKGGAMIGENPDKIMALETGAALAVSLFLFMLLPFKGFQYTLAQFFGVVVMISTMHNAVHSAPGLFSAMFSPEWTAEVTELTEPNSLYLRGETLHFVKPEEQEKKLPTVRRLG